ncbi:MAG: TldD/PmbA family protein [Halobacteriota archaeon]|nr:TldD/PmbA family protein [Halobacteriota archaeon]
MTEPVFYDIRTVETFNRSIVIDDHKVKEITSKFSKGSGIRALVGGSWGFVTTNNLRKTDDLKAATSLARNLQKRSPRDPLDLRETEPNRTFLQTEVRRDPRDVPVEDKVELIKDIEKNTMADKVVSSSATYFESLEKVSYENSQGSECRYEVWRVGVVVGAVAKENGIYQSGRENKYGICGFELFDSFDHTSLARKASKTAVELLSAGKAPGGKMMVVLDQELAGVFAHEALGHASEADLVLEGNSILEGKIGEEIASEIVNVYDDPCLLEFGYFPFDDEGLPQKKKMIIEEGVFRSYLHNRETASKLDGVEGNARAEDYSEPIVRMSNTYIGIGDSSFESILGDVKDGVYLIGSRGGQVNTGEGIFQFNAERGYLIENGELTRSLSDVSLSGETLEILRKIELVGNDLKFNPGYCGKNNQLVPVSDGSPHILVSEALVGGA